MSYTEKECGNKQTEGPEILTLGNSGTVTGRLSSQYVPRMRKHEFKPHINQDFGGLTSGRALNYMKFLREVQEIYSDFIYLKVCSQSK